MKQKVVFYPMQTNKAKIEWLVEQANHYFYLKSRLLIRVPNLEVADFVDSVLWRHPEESFLPHIVSDLTSTAEIVITIQQEVNNNQAPYIMNLTPNVCEMFHEEVTVLEVFDQTSEDKKAISEKKLLKYKEKGVQVQFA